MNPPRLFALFLLAAAYLALGASAFGQTIKYLGYNLTNYTVVGWTNTNSLLFTNPVSVGDTTINAQGLLWGGALLIDGEQRAIVATNGDPMLSWDTGVLAAFVALDFNNATNKATTRSNLFGSAGISTNIQFVRVGGTTNTLIFSNGILHSVTTP